MTLPLSLHNKPVCPYFIDRNFDPANDECINGDRCTKFLFIDKYYCHLLGRNRADDTLSWPPPLETEEM